MLTIVFAYYTYRVGQAYEIGTVQIAGLSYMIIQLTAIPLLLVAYQYTLLPQLISDPHMAVTQLTSMSTLLVLSGLLDFVFSLVFLITFAIGLNRMGIETGIDLFQVAKWIVYIAVILSFLNSILSAFLPINLGGIMLQISIIVYGLALSRVGKPRAVPERLGNRIVPEQG